MVAVVALISTVTYLSSMNADNVLSTANASNEFIEDETMMSTQGVISEYELD